MAVRAFEGSRDGDGKFHDEDRAPVLPVAVRTYFAAVEFDKVANERKTDADLRLRASPSLPGEQSKSEPKRRPKK